MIDRLLSHEQELKDAAEVADSKDRLLSYLSILNAAETLGKEQLTEDNFSKLCDMHNRVRVVINKRMEELND